MKINTAGGTGPTRALTLYQRPARKFVLLKPIERLWPSSTQRESRASVHTANRKIKTKGCFIDIFV